MAPFSLMTTSVGWLAKSFSVLSCKSSLRCTSILPAAYINPVKCLTTQATGPPKRPLNGYMRYCMQQRPILLRENPNIRPVDLTKKIAQQWRTLSPEQKRPFEEHYQQLWEKFKADYEVYKAKLTPAEVQKDALEKRQRRAKKESTRKRRELNSMGKPKRPRTAFNIYISENYKEARGLTAPAKMKSMFEDWRNLFSHQKQVYMQLAEDDKIRYKNEMRSWEEHMIDIGRDDLLRGQTLSYQKRLAQKIAASIAQKKANAAANLKTMKKSNTIKTVRSTKKK